MEILVLLLWAVCIVGCCYSAAEKNRSVVLWGLSGFFFGIFALLVLMFLPDVPKALVIPNKED